MQDRSEMLKEYRKLARRADDRMRRIEAVSRRKEYKGIKEYAYKGAIHNIQKVYGSAGKRWNTAPPETDEGLLSKINSIKAFLEKPTSTIRGITDVYKRRADTLNANWGSNFKWQDLANYYNTGLNYLFDSLLGGSGDALPIVGQIQKSGDTIIDAIKSNKEIYIVTDLEEYNAMSDEEKAEFDARAVNVVVSDDITASEIDNLLQQENGRQAVADLLSSKKKPKKSTRKGKKGKKGRRK